MMEESPDLNEQEQKLLIRRGNSGRIGRPEHYVRQYFRRVSASDPKSKRYDCACKMCNEIIRRAKPEGLIQHLQSKCTKASLEGTIFPLFTPTEPNDVPSKSSISAEAPYEIITTDAQKSSGSFGRPPHYIWEHFDRGDLLAGARRRTAICKYCPKVFKGGRPEKLLKHIVSDCTGTTETIRATVGEAAAAEEQVKKRKISANSNVVSSDKKMCVVKDPKRFTSFELMKHDLDMIMLRWVVNQGLPFDCIDDPFFCDLFRKLSPQYSPPGSLELGLEVANREYINVRLKIAEVLKSCGTITVTVHIEDHIETAGASILVINAGSADQPCYTIGCCEINSVPFPVAEQIAGKIDECCVFAGIQRVGAVIIEDTPELNMAKNAVFSRNNYRHVIDIRCYMRALIQMAASFVSHDWMREVLVDAQTIVMCIRNQPEDIVQVIRNMIGGNLEGIDQSNFSSYYNCVDSLRARRQGLDSLVLDDENMYIFEIIKNAGFWMCLGFIRKILEPIHLILSAAHENKLVMFDIVLAILKIGRQIIECLPHISDDTGHFLVHTYILHVKELDMGLARLALFLDPRYKDTANTGLKFDKLLEKAGEVMQRRGFSEEQFLKLVSKLQDYKEGVAPFDKAYVGPSFDCRTWWTSLHQESNFEIVNLALLLLDITPYCSDIDRIFEDIGWFAREKKLYTGFDPRVFEIRMFHQRHLQSLSRKNAAHKPDQEKNVSYATVLPSLVLCEQLNSTLLNLKESSFAYHDLNQRSSEVPARELMIQFLDGFDMEDSRLESGFIPPVIGSSLVIPALGAYSNEPYDVAALIQARSK